MTSLSYITYGMWYKRQDFNILRTARPVSPSDFIPFDRANQELQNAFLDESLAQKEAEI